MSENQRVISIPAKFFDGEGKLPYHVAGRENGDIDDTCLLVLADSRAQAEEILIDEMLGCLPWEDEDMTRDEWEEKFNKEDSAYFILWCDALFDTKPGPEQPE